MQRFELVTREKYLLAKEVENAFEENKDMLMRKTVKSDAESPEEKNPSVSLQREV